MPALDIKETDVVELTDDNQLYFVLNVNEDNTCTVRDLHGDTWSIDSSRIVNVWRHIS